jgi:DNA-binding CsgD family transcriptional regulator
MLTAGPIRDERRSSIPVEPGRTQHLAVVRSKERPTHTHNDGRPVCCWDSLTKTERQVAILVAEGLTNREVAECMVLSRHTVDFHLRRVYLKLHINSRVQLTRLVIEQGRQAEGWNRQPSHHVRPGERSCAAALHGIDRGSSGRESSPW